MQRSRRFTVLEGMRGIAALCVVLMHGSPLFRLSSPASAYLAVDFFFVLSGFVIAHAYEKHLRAGTPPAAFLWRRILRLYPLYLAGTLSAVVLAAWSLLVRNSSVLWDFEQPAISLPFALVMLPSPASDNLYPLDVPAWSLLLELIVNAAFAVRWLRSTAALSALMAVAGAALVAGALLHGGLDLGWGKSNAGWGLARVFFSFPLGVLIHRYRARIPVRPVVSILPVLLLGALLFAAPAGLARVAFDLGFVVLLSPGLLLMAASCGTANARLNNAYLFLGAISYPIYILHHPILAAVSGTIARHVPPGFASIAAEPLVLAGLVGAAWGAAVLDGRIRNSVRFPLLRAPRGSRLDRSA